MLVNSCAVCQPPQVFYIYVRAWACVCCKWFMCGWSLYTDSEHEQVCFMYIIVVIKLYIFCDLLQLAMVHQQCHDFSNCAVHKCIHVCARAHTCLKMKKHCYSSIAIVNPYILSLYNLLIIVLVLFPVHYSTSVVT